MIDGKKLVLEARKQNEMPLCFLGKDKYDISSKYDPATFIENIILIGIDKINKEDNTICLDFMNTIKALCELRAEEFYIAHRYIICYLSMKEKNKIKFEIEIDSIKEIFASAFEKYKNELKAITSIDRILYVGNPYISMVKKNEICIKKYGINLISNITVEKLNIQENIC